MKPYFRVCMSFLLLSTACAPISAGTLSPMPVETSTPLLTSTPVFTTTSVLAVTTAPTYTPTSIPTPKPVPTNVPVEPPIESRCPLQPEVLLSDLGLGSTSRLVVVPSDGPTPNIEWMIIGKELIPKRIPTSHKPLAFMGISPNQHWFAFYTQNGGNDLWISTVDGQTQRRVLSNVEHPRTVQWVNDQTIVLFEGLLGYNWPITSKRLNPFTLEITPLSKVYLEYSIYAFSPDASRVIYLDRYTPRFWKLYDFQTNTTKTVLPWANTNFLELPFDAFIHWTQSGVSIAMTGSAGLIELNVNLPSDMLDQRDLPTWKVLMPKRDSYSGILWWSSDNQLVGLLQKSGEYKGDPSASRQFYILDITRQVLFDYCLPEELNPGQIYSSADERFLAWPSNYDSKSGHFEKTVVMELATGRRAVLDGMAVIGWGELLDENATATPSYFDADYSTSTPK